MNEKPPSLLLDEKWARQFREIGLTPTFEYLHGEKAVRDAERDKFFAENIRNPTFDYPAIDIAQLDDREKSLIALKENILADTETDEKIKQLYHWRINEEIASLRMLRATAENDMRRFRHYAHFVYGKASNDVFAYTLNNLHAMLDTDQVSDNHNLRNAATALKQILPPAIHTVLPFSLPTGETVGFAQRETRKEMAHIIDISATSDAGAEIDANGIAQAFEAALRSFDADGWKIVIDKTSRTGISVDQETKEIKIPADRKTSHEKLEKLIAHEIGTHVARRMNGERSKLQLLGIGLDRYGNIEEGIGTMREQAWTGQVKDFSGLEGHLAIALAQGVDGKKRDFREVYEILFEYFLYKAVRAGKDKTTAEKQAKQEAWNRCTRTFRGTDCKTHGVCLPKDIWYRQGNINTWHFIGERPDELIKFKLGKYDPTNNRHFMLLSQLGIFDSEIEST